MPWVTENKYIYCTYIWAQHRISYFCSIHVPALGLEANGDRLGGVYNGLLGMGVVKGTGLLDHWGESSLMVTFQHITMNPWILHVLYKQATFIKSLLILNLFFRIISISFNDTHVQWPKKKSLSLHEFFYVLYIQATFTKTLIMLNFLKIFFFIQWYTSTMTKKSLSLHEYHLEYISMYLLVLSCIWHWSATRYLELLTLRCYLESFNFSVIPSCICITTDNVPGNLQQLYSAEDMKCTKRFNII